ncbi:MAG TPA: choice-of-anchor tandem repeat GloVer-containing protein [Kofleriaceae bacterium]
MQYKLYGLTIVTLSACSAPPAEVGIAADGLTGGLTVLHTFGAGEGNAPRGALAEVNGRLYGLNGEGGPNATANCNSTANWNTDEHIKRCPGSLFSLALDGSGFRIEHAFTELDGNRRNLDGYHPYGSLAVGPDGTLYGVTQTGGAPPAGVDPDQMLIPGYGVLFSFNPATHAFTTLHTFFSVPRALDGEYPMGLPAVDADGNVYGTAKGGGSTSTGTVWRYSPGGGFIASPLPGETYGGVALAQGVLHGTTWARGANGVGDYFTVNPSTMAVTAVASFPGYTANDHGTDNTPIQAPTRCPAARSSRPVSSAAPMGPGSWSGCRRRPASRCSTTRMTSRSTPCRDLRTRPAECSTAGSSRAAMAWSTGWRSTVGQTGPEGSTGSRAMGRCSSCCFRSRTPHTRTADSSSVPTAPSMAWSSAPVWCSGSFPRPLPARSRDRRSSTWPPGSSASLERANGRPAGVEGSEAIARVRPIRAFSTGCLCPLGFDAASLSERGVLPFSPAKLSNSIVPSILDRGLPRSQLRPRRRVGNRLNYLKKR